MKPIRKRLPWFNLVLLALLIAFLFSALIHHLDMGGGCKESSYNNERQIVLAALVYANDNDGNWPKNLAEIKYEFPDMKAKVFTSPECPASISPFCYVRPVPTAEADQPVLIEDPACERGKGSTI